MTSAGSQSTLDGDDADRDSADGDDPAGAPHRKAISATALGPADVRDTPLVKPSLALAAEDEEDAWIGKVLSNVYEIEAKIGEGGMGSVYLARHIHLEKAFAVKVLVDTIATKSNAVDRLRREALATAQIDHENIVEVVNFDRTDDGAVFIVMELLKGEDLSDVIARGPVELHRALPIAFQICRALQAAHDHNIVHRDLKPENIFLTEKRGRTLAKVLDFGISKIKSAEAEQVKMTKTGQLVGTPLYMSPEQARGESEIDRRVDVYALGVILFEMLTGVPPFEGRNYFELLWKHGNEEPPSPREVNPNQYIPEAVEAVVLRTLSKDRDARYQTMAELEAALIEAAPEVPSLPAAHSLPPERPSRDPATGAPEADEEDLGRAPTALDVSSTPPPANTAEVALPQTNRTPLIAVGVGALLALGAAAYFLTPSEPESTPAVESPAVSEAPPSVEPPVADPPVVASPPVGVDPPPAPARVSLTLRSQPEGATVFAGDDELGTTPLVAPMPVSDAPVTLRFELAGHLDQTLSVVPAEGVEVPSVRLRRRRRAVTDSPGGTTLPIKGSL